MRGKKILVALVATGVGVIAGVTIAGVTGTPHQFAGVGSGATWNTTDELCKPCHTPHNADTVLHPLWNHAYQPSSAFTLHDDAVELGSESLTCLSCHDGQTALDAFGGGAGTSPPLTGNAALGTDLSNDHPVGVEYPDGSTRFGAVGSIWGGQPAVQVGFGGLPLWDDGAGGLTIECATCHTPHDNDNGDFLRVPNDNPGNPSGMCVACHITHK